MKLNEFREIYEVLQKKHSLPRFDEMNSIFDIGKIKRDSGNLLRDTRHMMNEKISYYIRLIEVIINPSQASPTFMMLLKEINKEDKKVLDSVFTIFMGLEIESYRMNIESTEVQEAEFISRVFKIWKENVLDLNKVINMLERNWKQTKVLPKQNRGYFN